MFCEKCGAQIPDDAVFCPKCGAKQEKAGSSAGAGNSKSTTSKQDETIVASPEVQELKCPGCGAPIKPQFGEMVITCDYCGTTVSLANEGWKNIKKHTMLPITIATQDQAVAHIKDKMDHGLLRKHLEEQSKLESLNLGYIPYWIVPVSARTNYTAVDAAVEIGTIAATAAIMGLAGGSFGGGGRGRGGLGLGLVEGTMIGGMVGGGNRGSIRAYTLNENYNYPVVGSKAMTQYQPRDYAFTLSKRVQFDSTKIPKGIKVLNGDVSEDSAEHIAKTNVEQIQTEKVHKQHHMIRSIQSQSDVAEPELMHVPVWFARFEHKGKKIVLVMDGSSGGFINSIGLD